MTSDGENLWRGTSSDDRAGGRRERLLAACREIVAADGGVALSVRAVCRAANVGPRHFYESFPDTDALLLAAYDQAVRALQQAISTAVQKDPEWSREPVDARLRVTFEAAAEHLEARPDAGRLIFREALGNDVLRTHAAVTLPAFAGTIRSLVVDGNDRRPAVRRQLEATVISGGLAAAFAEWLSGGSGISRDALVTYCTDTTLAILSLA